MPCIFHLFTSQHCHNQLPFGLTGSSLRHLSVIHKKKQCLSCAKTFPSREGCSFFCVSFECRHWFVPLEEQLRTTCYDIKGNRKDNWRYKIRLTSLLHFLLNRWLPTVSVAAETFLCFIPHTGRLTFLSNFNFFSFSNNQIQNGWVFMVCQVSCESQSCLAMQQKLIGYCKSTIIKN